MRKRWVAVAVGTVLAGPAAAQSLNDAGRLLQQFLPGQQAPGQGQTDRDRAIYEQGRRDAQDEQARRREDRGRSPRDDRRRGGPDRPYDDADRPPPPGRYQPDNR